MTATDGTERDRRPGTVLVTGGASGLGAAVALAVRAAGGRPYVLDLVAPAFEVDHALVDLADRVAVLEALGCVDVVVPFDERTPEAVLQRLRPDVFAKGGDYALADLPEAELLATWGGQAVVLPYLEGRSTTQLMKEVVRRDSH